MQEHRISKMGGLSIGKSAVLSHALSALMDMPAPTVYRSARSGPGKKSVLSPRALNNRSKYVPHQGKKECERRQKQMHNASNEIRKFVRSRPKPSMDKAMGFVMSVMCDADNKHTYSAYLDADNKHTYSAYLDADNKHTYSAYLDADELPTLQEELASALEMLEANAVNQAEYMAIETIKYARGFKQ